MANKVDVFTEELSKVFTILQQQCVMIKYMKALITSGELDDTEIGKLKEQITLINNQIQHINEKMGIIQNDITGINSKINNNTNTINALNSVMPTDINVDIAGNLILEHDGIEITGQKKKVAVYTKAQVNALINDAGLQTFTLEYPYTGMNPTVNHKKISITYKDDINTVYKCINYVKENGACLLKIRSGNVTSSGYSDLNPVFVLCLLVPNSDTSTIECHGIIGEYMTTLVSNGDITSQDNTYIIFDKIVKASDIKNVYRHHLILHTTAGEFTTCFSNIYSSNNLKVNSLKDLSTLLNPNSNTVYQCISTVTPNMRNLVLIYINNMWQIGELNNFMNPVTSVEDIVTTI